MTWDEMKNKIRYICDFEGCRHRNEENVCCLFNQENCVYFKKVMDLKSENLALDRAYTELYKQYEEVKANADYQVEGRDVTIKELEEKLKHAEEKCINKTCVVFKDKEDCVAKLLELEKENAELKEALEGYKKIAKWCDKCDKIAELKSENQKWKDEWQEQVQKATDEGYARTLQTIQLNKAKKIIQRLVTKLYKYTRFTDDVLAEAEQFLKE